MWCSPPTGPNVHANRANERLINVFGMRSRRRLAFFFGSAAFVWSVLLYAILRFDVGDNYYFLVVRWWKVASCSWHSEDVGFKLVGFHILLPLHYRKRSGIVEIGWRILLPNSPLQEKRATKWGQHSAPKPLKPHQKGRRTVKLLIKSK